MKMFRFRSASACFHFLYLRDMSSQLYDSDIFNLASLIHEKCLWYRVKQPKGIVKSKKRGAHKAGFGTNNDSVGSIKPQKSRRGRNAHNYLTSKLLLVSQGQPLSTNFCYLEKLSSTQKHHVLWSLQNTRVLGFFKSMWESSLRFGHRHSVSSMVNCQDLAT